MRFAVISDIHGNRSALEAVLAATDKAGITRVFNLGDSLSGPFDPAGTVKILTERAIPSIRGNHDRMVLDPPDKLGLWESWTVPELGPADFEWVRSLPETIDIDNVHMCHAAPGDDAENWLDHRGQNHRMAARDRAEVERRAKSVDAKLILTGHTHTPRMVRLTGGRMVVNPGSVGCPAYFDNRTDPPFIHETGAPDARYAVIEIEGDAIEVALCSTPYDPAEMQALAQAKGADTWATAIASGWFTAVGSE